MAMAMAEDSNCFNTNPLFTWEAILDEYTPNHDFIYDLRGEFLNTPAPPLPLSPRPPTTDRTRGKGKLSSSLFLFYFCHQNAIKKLFFLSLCCDESV